MTEQLHTLESVVDFLAKHPGSTLEDIARGLTARDGVVRAILVRGCEIGLLVREGRGTPKHPARYSVSQTAVAGLGRQARKSQNVLIAAVLRDGRPHTTAEIHKRCGFSRLNSRIADLRDTSKRWGMDIVCSRIDNRVGAEGSNAYEYQLVGYKPGFDENGRIGTSDAAADGGPSPVAAASDASHDSPGSTVGASDSQIGEAA